MTSPLEECEFSRERRTLTLLRVIAGEMLWPGQRVGVIDGRALSLSDWIGVVDPFLDHTVNKGEEFWLYPRPTVQPYPIPPNV